MLMLIPLHHSSWSISIKIAVQMAGQYYCGCKKALIKHDSEPNSTTNNAIALGLQDYLVFCFFGVGYWVKVRV